MTLKDWVISGGVVVALILGYMGVTQPTIIENLGATAGPEYFETQRFLSNFDQGGGIRATSTDDTSTTFLATDFDVETTIAITPTAPGITATLPASSTMPNFLRGAGMTRVVTMCNATTSAQQPFTLAGGTGMDVVNSTSTLAINTGDCAQLRFIRQTDSDFWVLFDQGNG